MKNQTSTKKIKAQVITVITIIVIIFGYITYDFFFKTPKIDSKVETVRQQVNELKTYLDQKIPSIDTAIIRQNEQLKQLKEVSQRIQK